MRETAIARVITADHKICILDLKNFVILYAGGDNELADRVDASARAQEEDYWEWEDKFNADLEAKRTAGIN